MNDGRHLTNPTSLAGQACRDTVGTGAIVMMRTRTLARAGRLAAVLVGLVLAGGLTSSLAGGTLSGRWWTQPKLVERLGLTEAQVEKIDELAFDWKEQKISLKAEVERAELEAWRVLNQERIDEAEAEAVLDRMVDARCELLRGEGRHRLEVAKLLSLEQRQELMRIKDEVKRRLRSWRHAPRKKLGPTGTDPSSP